MAIKHRNLAARTPLMRKGGMHRNSKTAERSKAKQQLRQEVRLRAMRTSRSRAA